MKIHKIERLSKKQKAFLSTRGWTMTLQLFNLKATPCWTVPVSGGAEIRPASRAEMMEYSSFNPGMLSIVTSELMWVKSWFRIWIDKYNIWKATVIADKKSKNEQGRTYWVLRYLDGKYYPVNRDQIKRAKRRGFLPNSITFLDVDNNAAYCTKRSILKDKTKKHRGLPSRHI